MFFSTPCDLCCYFECNKHKLFYITFLGSPLRPSYFAVNLHFFLLLSHLTCLWFKIWRGVCERNMKQMLFVSHPTFNVHFHCLYCKNVLYSVTMKHCKFNFSFKCKTSMFLCWQNGNFSYSILNKFYHRYHPLYKLLTPIH